MKKSHLITATVFLFAISLFSSCNFSKANKGSAQIQDTQISAETNSIEYERESVQERPSAPVNHYQDKYDFMINVLNNPSFTIGDFLSEGLNPYNGKLEDVTAYLNSKNVREDYEKYVGEPTYDNIRSAYYKIQSAWNILKEVYENYDMDKIRVVNYSLTAPRVNIFAKDEVDENAELASKLSIVPLNQ